MWKSNAGGWGFPETGGNTSRLPPRPNRARATSGNSRMSLLLLPNLSFHLGGLPQPSARDACTL
jgi:hypothetical protein